MDWFIKKGSTVEEKAFRLLYCRNPRVSAERPGTITCPVYTSSSDHAPMYNDGMLNSPFCSTFSGLTSYEQCPYLHSM